MRGPVDFEEMLLTDNAGSVTMQGMTFEQARAHRDALELACKVAGEALDRFPTGQMGLTPDAVKALPEWRKAKEDFNRSFAALRGFNVWFTRNFKTEIRASRRGA